LARDLERVGVDGILSVTPYYNKPTPEGLYQHFKAIADATPLKMVLYNVPGRTGVNLDVATVVRLSAHPNIVGVKEASANVIQMCDIVASTPEDFMLISGDDPLIVAVMGIGGRGVISVASNVIPASFRQLVDLARARNVAQAEALDRELEPICLLLGIEPNPIPVKAMLAALDLCEDLLRLPLLPLSTPHRAALEQASRLARILEARHVRAPLATVS